MTSLSVLSQFPDPRPEPANPTSKAIAGGYGWLELFIIAQIVLPALLYIPGTQVIRLPIRVAPFGLSICGLIWMGMRKHEGRFHPAVPVLIFAVLYVATTIFSPSTSTFLAGFGQTALYLSVFAPLLWVPLFVKSVEQVNRVLLILLVCNGINACVGVMQVISPQTWLPSEFSSVVLNSTGVLTYTGADGREVIRPPGLSDNPGAVCGPATTAAVLGLINCVRPIRWWIKLAGLGFAFAGVAAVFLSHVRTNLLILGGMVIIYALLLLLQREGGKALLLAGIAVALSVGSFFFAVMLGGSAVTDRFATLIEEDPTSVYYGSARGYMLQYDTMNYVTSYPMGAGLGRWGMMRTYFGDDTNISAPPLWAEVQYPAWALDGGIILLVAYNVALIIACYRDFSLSMSRNKRFRDIAATILAINSGTIALMFGFTPFTTQVGLQFWFLVGLLYGLWMVMKRSGEVV